MLFIYSYFFYLKCGDQGEKHISVMKGTPHKSLHIYSFLSQSDELAGNQNASALTAFKCTNVGNQ